MHYSVRECGGPLLTVVIPVYGTEKYLPRCLDSVLAQSYKNLEVILVNDCSPGNAWDIIEDYQKIDCRVKAVNHEKNKGLFQARLTGAQLAQGEYIAFVDSDDYISIDYYREMITQAVKGDFDVVASNTVREDENGKRFVFTLHTLSLKSASELYGDDVRNSFYRQEGSCYAWHTIWNKIYKKALWDICAVEYQKIQTHLIMTEDIAFSSVIFYWARSFSYIDGGYYFYCANGDASTNSSKLSFAKYQKSVKDILLVFRFVAQFLRAVDASEEIISHFRAFQQHYYRLWKNIQEHRFAIGNMGAQAGELIEQLNTGMDAEFGVEDYYFETLNSTWYGGFEEIKQKIISEQIKVVSFDIFDTLLLRPFWNPTDIFEIMQQDLDVRCPALKRASFKNVRCAAESCARERMQIEHPAYEDVNLTEIYQELSAMCGIRYEDVAALEAHERELELHFSTARRSAKDLYLFAKACGKRVVLTSDMYLDRSQIEAMLEKNGYREYDALFVSSETRLLKGTGHLFDYMLSEMGVKAENVLHIGDNWEHDICVAKQKKIHTAFLPKTKDRFCNSLKETPTNNCSTLGCHVGGNLTTWNKQMASIGYRTMMAMVANQLFDNPFAQWDENSDFGGNPYYMGYYAVGMHLIGVCKWLADIVEQHAAKHIVFLSRDGYLPIKVFSALAKCWNMEQIDLRYVPCSRRAVLPWMIIDEGGLFDLPLVYNTHTPLSLIDLLGCCVRPMQLSEIEGMIKKAGFIAQKPFNTDREYYSFLKWFRTNLFSQELLEEQKQIAAKFYNQQIPEDSIVFDLGYSGRIPAALQRCLNHKVLFTYVHQDNAMYYRMKDETSAEIITMYNFVPPYSGLIREFFLSEQSNSCIGLTEREGIVSPVFEKDKLTYVNLFATDQVTHGAYDFAKEFAGFFEDCSINKNFDEGQVSMPFEGLIHLSNDVDRSVFAASYTDDGMYNNDAKISFAEFWKGIPIYHAQGTTIWNYDAMVRSVAYGKSKIAKLVIYAVCDRKTMKLKIKQRLENHKIVLFMAKKGYSAIKWIWHVFKRG